MNRNFSGNVSRPQCIRLYKYIDSYPNKLEGFAFIGAQHSTENQKTFQREFNDKTLSESSISILQTYFHSDIEITDMFVHPHDSSQSVSVVPIFVDIFPRTSVTHFRRICEKHLNDSEETKKNHKLYFWYETPHEFAVFQAKRLIESGLSREGLVDYSLLQKMILFPYNIELPEYTTSHDEYFKQESVDIIVQEIARRQFTETCLETGRTISLFDHEAIEYIYKLAEKKSNDYVPGTVQSTVIFCTDKETIRATFASVTNTTVALESFFKTIEHTRDEHETILVDTDVINHISQSKSFTPHSHNTHMKSCTLNSPFRLRSPDIERTFNTFCLSTQVVASCFSDPQRGIQKFMFFGPDVKRRSKFGNGANKDKMIEWITNRSKYRTHGESQVSFQVLVGQVATHEFMPCTIKKCTKSTVLVEFLQPNLEGEYSVIQKTFSMSTAEFLFVWNTEKDTFQNWIKGRKNVQMYNYSEVFIQDNDENINDGTYIEYITGGKKGCFEHVHSSFIHTDERKKSVIVNTISVFATVTFTVDGRVNIEFDNDDFSPNQIPALQSPERLQKICQSFLTTNSILDQELVYFPNTFNMEIFTSSFMETDSHFIDQYTWPQLLKVKEFVNYIQAQQSRWNEHLLLVPTILYDRGETITFKTGPHVTSGTILSFHDLEYTVKTDFHSEKRVSFKSVIYDWHPHSVLKLVPRYSTEIKNVTIQWIIWCILQKKTHREIHTIVKSFVGMSNIQDLIEQVSLSLKTAFQTNDLSIIKMLFTPIKHGLYLQINENITTIHHKNILDHVEREKYLNMISKTIHNASTSNSPVSVKKNVPRKTIIKKIGFQFDLSDDDSDSDSDSSDSDMESKMDIIITKPIKRDNEIIPLQIDSLIERIQKLDSYFTGKQYFKDGYARSCQKSSGSQPLVLPPKEFAHIRDAYFQAYAENIGITHDSIIVCSPNEETDLQKNTCAAIEFRNNFYICPNDKTLLASISTLLPPKLVSEIERQQDHHRVYIGINSANAPCCFKKPNKNIHEYINATPVLQKNLLYSPYIKDWGHNLPPMRFGFCPPLVYEKLQMNVCDHGNITADSSHDCLLRLGIIQGPDVMLQCCRLIYTARKHNSPPIGLREFKKEICSEILKLNVNKDRELLSPFSVDFSSEKQNFVEYILSQQCKVYSKCLPILHKLMKNIRIVILMFEAGKLRVKCISSGSHTTTNEHACFLLETSQNNKTVLEILVHVDSSQLKLNTFSSVKCIFTPDDLVQGQHIYQIFMGKYTDCIPKTSSITERSQQFIPFPSIRQYQNHLILDEKPVQIQDAYGKVIAVQIQYESNTYVLPTLLTTIDSGYEVTDFSIEHTKASNAILTYKFIQKIIDVLKFKQLQPIRTIGTIKHIHCFEFGNGQMVPVLPTAITDFKKSYPQLSHSTESIYSDINKIVLETKVKYNTNILKFAPLSHLTDVMEHVQENAECIFSIEALYRIPQTQNIGILAILCTHKYTKEELRCGVHVDLSNINPLQKKLPHTLLTEEEPTFMEQSCIEALLHFWRHSNYTVYCRPYRYKMNAHGNYTHLVIENGNEIRLHTPVHCLSEIDGIFRSEKLNIVELYHETEAWLDVASHKDMYDELEFGDTALTDEIRTLKKKWTREQQSRIFEIVNSSKMPQSQYFSLQKHGYSGELSHRLIQDPLFIKEWIEPEYCPNNSVVISGLEAAKLVFNSFYQHEQRSYYMNMLEFHYVVPIMNENSVEYPYVMDKKQRIRKKISQKYTQSIIHNFSSSVIIGLIHYS